MHITRSIQWTRTLLAPLVLTPLVLTQVTLGQTGVGACFTEEPLLASDGTDRELFGSSVAVEGRLMVIGAEGWSGLGFPGKAYVFGNQGGSWGERAVLIPSDSSPEDHFGSTCDVDRGTVVVGAWGNDHLNPGVPFSNAGAAYVFRNPGTGWVEVQRLTADDAGDGHFFGQAVAVGGPVVVVGAPEDDDTGVYDGSAYVFEDGPSGFQQVAKLVSNEPFVARFGASVAIDGDRIAVGAEGIGSLGSEATYVFVRSGGGWAQEARLVPADWQPDDDFGSSVALSGERLVVGAPQDDDACPSSTICQSGAAYVFDRTPTGWVERVKLKAASNQQGANDFFGYSVDVVGSLVMVGAPSFTSFGSKTGWAYAFVERGGNWLPSGRLRGADTAVGDQFGQSVSLSRTLHFVAGAPAEDTLGFAAGKAFAFRPMAGCLPGWLHAVASPPGIAPGNP